MAAKKLFYSMGEVAEMFDVNASLIRHWESKFDCIRPHKNKKGNRMFSPEDVEKLKQIYHLVKERGMTLDGANRAMKRSRKELSRETELLERLQRIRSALVEVREELKAGEGVQIVESPVLSDAEEPIETSAAVDAAVPATETAEPTSESSDVSEAAESEVRPESGAEPSGGAESPAKRPRRRRKSDDENKELFPFYEQSLF